MNAETPAAPKKKILVVDDNEVILKTVSLKLQGCGYPNFHRRWTAPRPLPPRARKPPI